MAEPFIGQLAVFGFNYAPTGWLQCLGQLLSIRQYPALFALLNTRFGGDGTTTFGLPNLQGSVPVGMGQAATGTNYALGENGGAVAITLSSATIPPHTHTMSAYNAAGTTNTLIANAAPAQAATAGGRGGGGHAVNIYAAPNGGPAIALAPASVTPAAGNSQPHDNMQPTLTANWCIAVEGVFPVHS